MTGGVKKKKKREKESNIYHSSGKSHSLSPSFTLTLAVECTMSSVHICERRMKKVKANGEREEKTHIQRAFKHANVLDADAKDTLFLSPFISLLFLHHLLLLSPVSSSAQYS